MTTHWNDVSQIFSARCALAGIGTRNRLSPSTTSSPISRNLGILILLPG